MSADVFGGGRDRDDKISMNFITAVLLGGRIFHCSQGCQVHSFKISIFGRLVRSVGCLVCLEIVCDFFLLSEQTFDKFSLVNLSQT
jgi:hypothetical protein